MPTVIDELIVRLGLDASKFTAGQKDAVERMRRLETDTTSAAKRINRTEAGSSDTTVTRQKRMQGAVKDTAVHARRAGKEMAAAGAEGAQFFTKLGAAGAAAGVAIAAVVATVKAFKFEMQAAGPIAALGRYANNLGMSPSALSAYGLAAQQFAGGNATTTEGSIGGLVQKAIIFHFTGRGGEMFRILSQIGVPLEDASHPNKLLLDLAHAMHHMKPGRAMTIGGMLGLDMGTINLLEQGRAALQRHLATVRGEGGGPNAHDVKEMEKFQTAVIALTTAFASLTRALEVDVAPAMTRIANIATDVITGNWTQLNKDMAPKNEKTLPGSIKHAFTGWSADQKRRGVAIMDAIVGGGYTPAGAAAAVGNAMQESSLNPHPKVDPANPHYGLWQWSASRRRRILAATGIDVATADTAQQIKALKWELTHTETKTGALMRSKYGANVGGQLFDQTFERSGDGPLGQMRRGGNADTALAWYRNAHASPYTGPRPSFARTPSMTSPMTGGIVSPYVDSIVKGLRHAQVQHVTNHHNTHVDARFGPVTVNTQATDGHGIARSILGAAGHSRLAMQANAGLN